MGNKSGKIPCGVIFKSKSRDTQLCSGTFSADIFSRFFDRCFKREYRMRIARLGKEVILIVKVLVFAVLLLLPNQRFAFSQEPERLPSLNYYAVLQEIPKSGSIISNVKLTPEEFRGLMRVKKDLYNVIADSFDSPQEASRFFRTGRFNSSLKIENVFKEKILEIIPPEKFESLIPAVMQSRFPYPWMPFQNREVIEHCGFQPSEISNLPSKIAAAEKKYFEGYKQVADLNAVRLLKELPRSSRQKLVELAGNYYFPDIEPPSDVNASSIPFPRFANPGIVAVRLREIHSAFGVDLTQAEQQKVNEICLNYVERIGSIVRPEESKGNIEIRGRKAGDQMTEEVTRLLGKKRLLQLYRQIVLLEIRDNPNTVFGEDSICDFLELSDEQREQIRQASLQTCRRNLEETAKWKRIIFDELLEVLSKPAREKMNSLFVGHWERVWD